MKVNSLSPIRLFATPWTVAYQVSPSMGFSRQEYWSGLPFPSPGDLPDPRTEPGSPALEADALTSEPLFKNEILREMCISPPSVVSSVAQSCPTLCDPMDCSLVHGILHPWDSSGKNTGVGYHFLLQGIFPTQGSNPGLQLCRRILYLLCHQGSPRID